MCVFYLSCSFSFSFRFFFSFFSFRFFLVVFSFSFFQMGWRTWASRAANSVGRVGMYVMCLTYIR